MLTYLRHQVILVVISALLFCGASSTAHSQPPPEQPAQPAQQPQRQGQGPQQGPASNVQIERSYTFDGILFVLLMGGAIFVVCRSSQRR